VSVMKLRRDKRRYEVDREMKLREWDKVYEVG
jgi:hypothetical protein